VRVPRDGRRNPRSSRSPAVTEPGPRSTPCLQNTNHTRQTLYTHPVSLPETGGTIPTMYVLHANVTLEDPAKRLTPLLPTSPSSGKPTQLAATAKLPSSRGHRTTNPPPFGPCPRHLVSLTLVQFTCLKPPPQSSPLESRSTCHHQLCFLNALVVDKSHSFPPLDFRTRGREIILLRHGCALGTPLSHVPLSVFGHPSWLPHPPT
jgi:hypothetical protein